MRASFDGRLGRTDLLAVALLTAGAAALYAATLCRSLYFYDSAEYATAAHNLGVPHPPGYPLYTLLAHLFVRVLPGSPAFAVNVFSAVSSVCAVGLSYAVARALGAGIVAAAVAGALLASAPSFWLNATIAEVYGPGLCGSLLVLWLLLRARSEGGGRRVIAAAALAGLALGLHYSLATLGLGLVWLALEPAWKAHGARGAVRLALACAAATALGFAVNLAWLVLRAPASVVPNHAHPPSAARLLWLVSGGNYRAWFTSSGTLLERSMELLGTLGAELSLGGSALALAGAIVLASRSKSVAAALGLAVLGNLAFFLRYRVHDLQVFLLPSVALLCVMAGIGLQAVAERLTTVRAGAWVARPPASWGLPIVLGGLLLVPRVVAQYGVRDLSGFDSAREYGERLCAQLPYSAVILSYTTPDEWKYDAVFGLYFQHVLGRRRDVIVLRNADRPLLNRLLLEHRPVYLYAPVAHVLREYAATRDGELLRVTARR